ncbi:MAG TPA: ArsA-related P-loop ATPase [Solirubrobacteraceae bacterium]|jgi:anion-transporting  ArsA/GET3 family ATPase|nr:ArsA-related P-loop ATPase [Solirubrobacteraceae bacterium]
MVSLLERKLIVVTGKGGVGKSTVASALGLAAAQRGLRTIVVQLGAQHQLLDLFAADEMGLNKPGRAMHADDNEHSRREHRPDRHDGEEIELQEGLLWTVSIDPDRALGEWLQTLTGRISARLLASSSTFQYFAAAAPGAKELVSMVKLRELCEGRGETKSGSGDSSRDRRGRPAYDLVVLDAPASGHALAMLRSPQTFSAILRVGPLAEQAQALRELLEDAQRSAYVAVTHASEMAVTETLELEEGLRRDLDRDLDAVIVNGTMPRRFTREELGRISAAAANQSQGAGAAVTSSAVQMARTVNDRARVQLAQIARLRRQRFAEGSPPVVLTVPFAFVQVFDLGAVRRIGDRLGGKI